MTLSPGSELSRVSVSFPFSFPFSFLFSFPFSFPFFFPFSFPLSFPREPPESRHHDTKKTYWDERIRMNFGILFHQGSFGSTI